MERELQDWTPGLTLLILIGFSDVLKLTCSGTPRSRAWPGWGDSTQLRPRALGHDTNSWFESSNRISNCNRLIPTHSDLFKLWEKDLANGADSAAKRNKYLNCCQLFLEQCKELRVSLPTDVLVLKVARPSSQALFQTFFWKTCLVIFCKRITTWKSISRSLGVARF